MIHDRNILKFYLYQIFNYQFKLIPESVLYDFQNYEISSVNNLPLESQRAPETLTRDLMLFNKIQIRINKKYYYKLKTYKHEE